MIETPFTLPRGFVDHNGQIHQHGKMRLATVIDEIEPSGHPRTQQNEAYALILLMSRVITQLGDITEITPALVERLYAVDMLYLEDLYLRLNAMEPVVMTAACPHCHSNMQIQVAPL